MNATINLTTLNLTAYVPPSIVDCESKLSVLMPKFCNDSSRYVFIILALILFASLALMVAYKFDWITTEQYVAWSQRLFPSFIMLIAPALYLIYLTMA